MRLKNLQIKNEEIKERMTLYKKQQQLAIEISNQELERIHEEREQAKERHDLEVKLLQAKLIKTGVEFITSEERSDNM